MQARQVAVDLTVAFIAGFVATKVSDRAQRLFFQATPVSEKLREPDYPDCSSAEQAARMAVDSIGIQRTEQRIQLLKNLVHYGLGMAWAALYPALRRRAKLNPLAAGVIAGTSLSLVVDEVVCPRLGITAPNSAYPISSHARGLATHLVYGIAVAVTAEASSRAVAAVSARRRATNVDHLPDVSPTVSAA